MSEIRNLTRNGETFYPLTTSSAVINEATGEGLVIDDEPTAGSNNLVKSGGTYDFVKENTLEEKEHLIADNDVAGYLTDKNKSIIGKLMKNGSVVFLELNNRDKAIDELLTNISTEVPDSGNNVIKYLTDKNGKTIATINNVGDTQFYGGGGFDGEITKSRNIEFDAVKILTSMNDLVIGWVTPSGKIHIEELEVRNLFFENEEGHEIEDFKTYLCGITSDVDLQAIGNMLPIDFNSDENGWEIPLSEQMNILIKKCDQMKNIKWTPKLATIPITSNASETVQYYDTVEQMGIPYSVNANRPVGLAVSYETFMTAINNKYSLMYTEDLLDAVSAWGSGVPHQPVNGHCRCYYGTHCNGFSSFVHGNKIAISCQSFRNTATLYHVYSPVFPQPINKNHLRQGDVIDSASENHIRVIYSVKRDANRNVTSIKVVESTGHANDGKVVVREYSGSNLNNYINSINNLGYKQFRSIQLYKNFDYEVSPFVSLEDETIEPYVYNNDVCTFAGNKATFLQGQTVVINFNLNDDNNWGFTQLKHKKDGEIIYSQNIADIDSSSYPTQPIVQAGHAWMIPDDLLTPGLYEVFAYNQNGGVSSEPTLFEVIKDEMIVEKFSEGVFEFSVEDYVLCGCFIYRIGSTSSSNRFSVPASEKEIENGKMRIYVKDLFEYDNKSYSYFDACIMVKGVYGSICTTKNTYRN